MADENPMLNGLKIDLGIINSTVYDSRLTNLLDAAKKERQDIKPGQRVVVAEADDDDLNEFDPVHPDRRDRQGLELFPETAAAVPDAQKHRQRDHHDHQRGNENQMLGGEIPLGRAAVPAESEKFLQKSVPPFSRILCFV